MPLFSINPGYDYHHGDYAIGNADERLRLYRRCEMEGVGISVMKAFSGGQLLNAKTSPFKKALTEYQCIQYALDKPAVLTVLPGIRGKADLERILGFCDAPEEEKDYSVIGTFAPPEAEGVCVYCNHCQPCPAGLDVAAPVTVAAADTVPGFFLQLFIMVSGKHISSRSQIVIFIDQRHFRVKQGEQMKEMGEYFGE
ncbi:MAG: hypothetical protein Q4E91_14210 [Lachnospiraceae bacterium]|nr:hypothetical protein [Lachnospiraceae bacterium]